VNWLLLDYPGEFRDSWILGFSGRRRFLKTSKQTNSYWTWHTSLFSFSSPAAQMFFTDKAIGTDETHCRRHAHAHIYIKLDVCTWVSVWVDPQALNQSPQIVCMWCTPLIISFVIMQLFNVPLRDILTSMS